jgi:hypothetical protein
VGELNGSDHARWRRTVEVFNEQGEAQQLKLFPSHVEPPPDDPQVARVLLNKVRLERTRQFGARNLAGCGKTPVATKFATLTMQKSKLFKIGHL